MKVSEFMRKKAENYFHFLDRDDDGWITFEDFGEIAPNIQKHGKMNEKRMVLFHEEEIKYWSMFEEMASKNGGKVNKEQFMQCLLQKYFPLDNTAEEESVYNGLLFDFIDQNSDGRISFEEFFCYYEAHNWTDRSHVMNIFNQVDTNGDGFLSREEFISVTVAYWTNDDPETGCAFLYEPKKRS